MATLAEKSTVVLLSIIIANKVRHLSSISNLRSLIARLLLITMQIVVGRVRHSWCSIPSSAWSIVSSSNLTGIHLKLFRPAGISYFLATLAEKSTVVLLKSSLPKKVRHYSSISSLRSLIARLLLIAMQIVAL